MSAIHHAGGGEIDGSLNPEGYVFGSDFIECAAHRGDADIAVHAEGGGEQARDEFPERWHSRGRPRQAAQEQHGYREEYEDEDAVFAAIYQRRERHGKEDAGQQVRDEETEECQVIAQSRQLEPAVDAGEGVDSHDEIDTQINQCLSNDNVGCPLIMAVRG